MKGKSRRLKSVNMYAYRILLVLSLTFWTSCSSEKQSVKNPVPAKGFAYTAKLINGQVFLVFNTNPASLLGPFLKQSADRYTCQTEGNGVRSLSKSPNGQWFYSWNYVQMRAQPVDASALSPDEDHRHQSNADFLIRLSHGGARITNALPSPEPGVVSFVDEFPLRWPEHSSIEKTVWNTGRQWYIDPQPISSNIFVFCGNEPWLEMDGFPSATLALSVEIDPRTLKIIGVLPVDL